MAHSSLKDHLSLLHGHYHFLYLGMFLEQIVQKHDLSGFAKDTAIQTSDSTQFVLKAEKIHALLTQIHQNPEKENILGYMVETNAIKGIVSVMKELIDASKEFNTHLRKQLDKQFFPFEQIIRFTRNVLNHAIDPQIIIKKDDFLQQKAYLHEHGVKNIHFLFKYADYIKERRGSDQYGIDVSIHFEKLKPGTPLHTAIPKHQLYLICELCYNLCKLYK